MLSIYLNTLPDGGHFYAETNTEHWLMEPWNAITSLFFLLPVFYWFKKLKGKYREHLFITLSLPLLFLGGLGSTLFHAFHVSYIFLLLDVLPMLILTASFSIYLWVKILPKWWYIFLVIVLFLLLQFGVFYYPSLSTFAKINISYFFRGIMMFLPAILVLKKTRFEAVKYLLSAVCFFILALLFRQYDQEFVFLMYMGSHWLWHVSTVVGAFLLAEYLYRLRNYELNQKLVLEKNKLEIYG